jgi:hypothetical protein
MLCGNAAPPTVRILAISYAVLIPQISYSRVGPASAPSPHGRFAIEKGASGRLLSAALGSLGENALTAEPIVTEPA